MFSSLKLLQNHTVNAISGFFSIVLVPYYHAIFIVTRHNAEQPGYAQVVSNNIKYYNHSLNERFITLVKYDKFIEVMKVAIKPK